MPGLVRKLVIFAAVDGLVLQPLTQRGQRAPPAATIAYKDSSIAPVQKNEGQEGPPGRSFEAFGVVGKYIFITSRRAVCDVVVNIHLLNMRRGRDIITREGTC
jgi:hypothetical protein